MNGKSIEIDNTDAEGRLVLAGETFRREIINSVSPDPSI